MVEILDQSSGKLIGLKVSGKLLHEDYQTFVPMLEKLIEEHGSVRCLMEMTDLHGIEPRALWDEIQFDVRHGRQIEALRRRRRSDLGGLDDRAVPADLLQRGDPVLRRLGQGQGVGMGQGGIVTGPGIGIPDGTVHLRGRVSGPASAEWPVSRRVEERTTMTTEPQGTSPGSWLAPGTATRQRRNVCWKSPTTSCMPLAIELMHRERPGHTLQPTDLVHEAVLRLDGGEGLGQGRHRAYFFGAMAQAMQRILVEHARRRRACAAAGTVAACRSTRPWTRSSRPTAST